MPTVDQSRKRAVDERLQVHKISETEYRAYNPTKGTSYSLLQSASGTWTCDCPFMTKGSHVGTSGVCKHLCRLFDKLRGCGKGLCRAGKLCASCKFEDRMLG